MSVDPVQNRVSGDAHQQVKAVVDKMQRSTDALAVCVGRNTHASKLKTSGDRPGHEGTCTWGPCQCCVKDNRSRLHQRALCRKPSSPSSWEQRTKVDQKDPRFRAHRILPNQHQPTATPPGLQAPGPRELHSARGAQRVRTRTKASAPTGGP